jgi:hypothetical protein
MSCTSVMTASRGEGLLTHNEKATNAYPVAWSDIRGSMAARSSFPYRSGISCDSLRSAEPGAVLAACRATMPRVPQNRFSGARVPDTALEWGQAFLFSNLFA